MVHFVQPKLRVVFYRSLSGREPVRDWLRQRDRASKVVLGEDIKTVQYGWSLGRPLVRSLRQNLWEVRSDLPSGTQARIVFVVQNETMVLLHGFVKKSRRAPLRELRLARQRAQRFRESSLRESLNREEEA